MKDGPRFKDWEYPQIEDGKLTKYNWMVQHPNNFNLGYKTDIGAFTYINAKSGVIIEDYVEIGANTVIDRSVLGKSVIGRGTKIDSLVYIAHNAEIGPDNIIAANTALAGSVTTGRGVWIGLASSIREGCRIGDEAYIGMGTVVINSVDAHKKVVGVPGRVIGPSD